MHEELYRILKRKREFLRMLVFSDLDTGLTREFVESKWAEYSPKKRDDFSVAVADGSQIFQSFIGFNFGLVGGYGYFYDLRYKDRKNYIIGDVVISFSKKPEFMKSYLSLLMFLSELKALYRISLEKKPDLIVFDGTITSRLITPFPRSDWFVKSEDMEVTLNTVCLSILRKIDKTVFTDYDGIYSTSLELMNDIVIPTLSESGINPRKDVVEAILAKIAYYEMMYILFKLTNIKDSLIVGIAKTSSGVDIFKSSVPDIKILSSSLNKLGYSKELIPQDIQKLKSSFGEIISDISSFLSDLQVFSFYSKYSTPRYINLIEFIQHPEKDTVKVEELLDMISSISLDGYPFLLKKVDNEVRITKEDLEFAIKEVRLEQEITGRDLL
ncbi:MAG: DNA double-strand break repair nuclease NurA [Hydrogenothermaceae bacterium]|nr:DNA double-strand break repair nuclease NurA [Hydrogenothermaceae bacterium]